MSIDPSGKTAGPYSASDPIGYAVDAGPSTVSAAWFEAVGGNAAFPIFKSRLPDVFAPPLMIINPQLFFNNSVVGDLLGTLSDPFASLGLGTTVYSKNGPNQIMLTNNIIGVGETDDNVGDFFIVTFSAFTPDYTIRRELKIIYEVFLNDGTHPVGTGGGGNTSPSNGPSLDFSDPNNSQYL